ncbi:MAG: methyl-accepting chemotaxis protein [Beijerinckiaceae bacterium]|nr:methyl-accepting chemotaxis protein [Beijerinckiaceae bacterium]MCZ8299627.1 methyl-accepting chemotaxis protein [Beijerinckiaceae bacterium]
MKTISSRLVTLLACLFLCIAALAVSAWVTTRTQSTALSTLYTGNIVPLRNLKIISDRYAVDVVDAAHKARAGTFSFDKASAAMKEALDEITRLWPVYRAQITDPAEAAKADAAARLLGESRKATEALIAITAARDMAKLVAFVEKDMYPAIDPATEAVGQLIDFQLVGAEATRNAAQGSGATTERLLAIFSLLALVLAATGGIYVVRGITRPLRRAITAMTSLAVVTRDPSDTAVQGLDRMELAGGRRSDEVGEIVRALETLRDGEIERRRLIAEAKAAETLRLERAQRVDDLIRAFEASANQALGLVQVSSNQLREASDEMIGVARTTSEQAGVVAAATHEAAESAKALTGVGDELASSIAEIGRQAEQSSAFASRAAHKARATDETVGKLSEAGRSIVEVVDLIKNIAGQTNLLALNATIEAARAGEAGRGFAVVAAEVKTLAAQTTRATEVISEQAMAIQEAATESIEAMQEITSMIEEINQVASSIAVAVTEQSQATLGIAENVQQVAQGSEHAAESISVVHDAARKTGTSADIVLEASNALKSQSDLLREQVDRFLHDVRAA